MKVPTPRAEALNPLLWFIGFTLGPTAIAPYSGQIFVMGTMLALGVGGAILFFNAYWHLLTKDPDRLQSEGFQKSFRQAESNKKEILALAKSFEELTCKLEQRAPDLIPEAEQIKAKVAEVQTANNAILEALSKPAHYLHTPASSWVPPGD